MGKLNNEGERLMRDWVKEAEAYLHSQYTQACAVLDANISPVKMTIAPRLEEDEARYFVLGLEEKLFSVDKEGYVQSSMLPHPTGKNTKQKMIQLFWTKKNGRGLFREGVCQLATVSSLILEYGCDPPPINESRNSYGNAIHNGLIKGGAGYGTQAIYGGEDYREVARG